MFLAVMFMTFTVLQEDAVDLPMQYSATTVVRCDQLEGVQFYVLRAMPHPIAYLSRGYITITKFESIDQLNQLLTKERKSTDATDQEKLSLITTLVELDSTKLFSAQGLRFSWRGLGSDDYFLRILLPAVNRKGIKIAILKQHLVFPPLSESDFIGIEEFVRRMDQNKHLPGK